ncbi:MAG: hypothetical protein Q8P86_03715 [bacterium]|nr:hypothetical protein [bacterium]
MKKQEEITPVPHEEEFELTLAGVPAHPIKMVRSDGYCDANSWKFKGPKVGSMESRWFRIVRIGHQPNVKAVNRVLAKYGTPARGQWREAYKTSQQYPGHNIEGLMIGFTGSIWLDAEHHHAFPCVLGRDSELHSFFAWVNRDFGDEWSFVVEVKKQGKWRFWNLIRPS